MKYSFWANAGQPWPDLLAGCRHAEETGWDGIWVADHFMPLVGGYDAGGGADLDDELGPVLEAWTMIGALAVAVPRVRIGTIVTGITYRHPAVLANMAATVDHISGGRLVVGVGASWQENEHQRYGMELGSPRERSDRFEEACEVLTLLFTQERATFDGDYYRLDGAPMMPKPIQDPIPLLIGGGGETRTLRTAARFATEWNVWGGPADMAHKISVLEAHCEALGRDPEGIAKSAAAMLVITDTEDKAEQVVATMGHRGGLVGTVDQLRATIDEYRAVGVDELIIPDFTMTAENRSRILDQFRAEVLRE
ncbi:MAG: TIGR03560 family F420-dependent LLM class oxidoreductase [Acidimicrobiales bacterium]